MDLKEKVIAEIKKIYDPEIPVNIYELGLIYDIVVNNSEVQVKICLLYTSPSPRDPTSSRMPSSA